MPDKAPHAEFADISQFPEAVRLLWEGTRKAVDAGIDTDDLAALCDIVVRMAEHRLLLLGAECAPSAEREQAADQLRHYRKLASDLYQWATAPVPEPDWAGAAEKLRSVGAAPLELQGHPEE
jgi:hypothetical protein